MRSIRFHIVIYFIALALAGCVGKRQSSAEAFFGEQLIQWNQLLTRVIITDVLTPPVCSRAYAYTNIAAYEALRPGYPGQPSYAGKLNDLENVPAPEGDLSKYYFPLSSVIAFSTVSQKVVFNADAILDLESVFLENVEKLGLDEEVQKRSIEYGRKVGAHIVEWAARDGYLQRNALPGYIVTRETGRWQPTPPDYMDAVEPNWHSLRPFVLDSASQFRPSKPAAFDTVPDSDYFHHAMEVYQTAKSADSVQEEIAKFWDCNPNISVTQGHVMYFQQKISPGGHWMNVGATACRKERFNAIKTAEVLSTLAITIADGFINCWEAKFHYNTIRPETVINKYIDKDWRPLLQTPPFPEFPSGHSVVSGASSAILSAYFGGSYSYIDSTEVPFGIPARKFASFNEAALEASMSRLYGGIHYLPSLNTGLEEGRQISQFVLSKLKSDQAGVSRDAKN